MKRLVIFLSWSDVMTIEDMTINIIIDDSDVLNQVFIEIENDNGESMRIGENLQTDEGYRRLRITTTDIVNNEKT